MRLRSLLRACVEGLPTGNASTDGDQLLHDELLADGGERGEGEQGEGDRNGGERDGGERSESERNGGERDGSDEDDGEAGEGDEDASDADRSNVEVTEAGEAEPADPKWEKPNLDDVPEFETGADRPVDSGSSDRAADDRQRGPTEGESSDSTADRSEDPTAGMPNEARSPNDSRIKKEGTEGYVVAVEICARLPEDVRLPEQAADLVPAAVEAELEDDIQSFTAAEFDNHSPHVDTLEFVERDDEVWFQLRIGVSPDAFSDLDPDEIRSHALQQLEGMF